MDASGLIPVIELFHLLFLAQFSRRADKGAFVVKDGCNLRFFHRSIRYSEDIDLDVGEMDLQDLRDRVRGVIDSRPFSQILEARGIRIEHVTEAKHTGTTQRWKFGLRIEGSETPIPTKIEFSNRGLDKGVEFGSIDAEVTRFHQLQPLMVNHYGAAAAFRQKVCALADRREIQARDVFDLHHLIAIGAGADAIREVSRRIAGKAIANALTVDFATFKSQVLAYLHPDEQARYDSESVWESIVREVVEALGGGDA
jgi:predicted nucleotidyltransferase component of viral defense system